MSVIIFFSASQKSFVCRNDVQAIEFLRKGSYAPGVNLISVISLVNCSRVRDPTTVAGKVFQSLITVGKYEYIVFVN